MLNIHSFIVVMRLNIKHNTLQLLYFTAFSFPQAELTSKRVGQKTKFIGQKARADIKQTADKKHRIRRYIENKNNIILVLAQQNTDHHGGI